jgi:hypothetical protein
MPDEKPWTHRGFGSNRNYESGTMTVVVEDTGSSLIVKNGGDVIGRWTAEAAGDVSEKHLVRTAVEAKYHRKVSGPVEGPIKSGRNGSAMTYTYRVPWVATAGGM